MIVIDPEHIPGNGGLGTVTEEISKMVGFIKASPPTADNLEGQVLAPGEMERNTRAKREVEGIAVPKTTFEEMLAAGESLGLKRKEMIEMAGVGVDALA